MVYFQPFHLLLSVCCASQVYCPVMLKASSSLPTILCYNIHMLVAHDSLYTTQVALRRWPYVGPTSTLTLAQRRLTNVGPTWICQLAQRSRANVGPTLCQRRPNVGPLTLGQRYTNGCMPTLCQHWPNGGCVTGLFVRGPHRSPMVSPHKGPGTLALMLA